MTITRTMRARFVPQAWIRDYAVEVDLEGDNEWDCTAAFAALPDDYRVHLDDEINETGEALDNDDCLKHDEQAPAWVRDWHGPFDIYVRPVYDQECAACGAALRYDAAGTLVDDTEGDVCTEAGDDTPHVAKTARTYDDNPEAWWADRLVTATCRCGRRNAHARGFPECGHARDAARAVLAALDDGFVLVKAADMARWADEAEEAADDIESWGAYASEYFKDKWDLDADVARAAAFANELRAIAGPATSEPIKETQP